MKAGNGFLRQVERIGIKLIREFVNFDLATTLQLLSQISQFKV